MNRSTVPSHTRVGIYVRESRDDNGEEYETIETQRDLLLDHVLREQLGQTAGIYIDDNVSGSVFEREGIELLKDDVISGRLDMLLVKDLSRLGRNNAKTLLFLDFLEEYGVRVVTYDKRYDSLKDNDTVGIETWYNERYVRDISKKIRANLRFKIEKGEYIGHAPYGYRKSQTMHNRLEIDENEAETVRCIYKLYIKGMGYGVIARALEEGGYAPPVLKWNSTTVQRILTNRVYLGDTIQGISERISFKSKKARRLPRDRWTVTEQTHEAVIEKEQYDEVQRLRSLKGTASGSHKNRIHLFSGILFCGTCGARMHARIRRGITGYICGSYGRKGRAACSSHYISEESINKIILDELYELYGSSDIRLKAAVMLDNQLGQTTRINERSKKIASMLSSKLRQQEVLYSDRLEERISQSLFERMNTALEDRIASLRRELEQVKSINAQNYDYTKILESAMHWAAKSGITRELAGMLVKRITVYNRGDRLENGESACGEGLTVVVDFRTCKV